MVFKDRNEFNRYINKLFYLGEGSQGKCYLDKDNNLVYKIFFDYYFDDDDCGYREEDIIKFSGIKNSTFIWPREVIFVGGLVVGYIMLYCNANNLYKIDPLNVNLKGLEGMIDSVYRDIDILTKNEVCLYDVRYNVLYNSKKIYIIDTLEYGYRKIDTIDNREQFDKEIMLFLVDSYFDDFVNSNKILKGMYMEYGVSSLDFLRVFRNSLSEYLDRDIVRLRDAKKLIKRRNNFIYIREEN